MSLINKSLKKQKIKIFDVEGKKLLLPTVFLKPGEVTALPLTSVFMICIGENIFQGYAPGGVKLTFNGENVYHDNHQIPNHVSVYSLAMYKSALKIALFSILFFLIIIFTLLFLNYRGNMIKMIFNFN